MHTCWTLTHQHTGTGPSVTGITLCLLRLFSCLRHNAHYMNNSNRCSRTHKCKHTYTHTHTHTHTHAYAHTLVDTRTHIYAHAYAHTYKHMHAHAHTYTHTHTPTRTQHSSIHTHFHAHMHTHTRAYAHVRINTCTRIDTHTQTHLGSLLCWQIPRKMAESEAPRTHELSQSSLPQSPSACSSPQPTFSTKASRKPAHRIQSAYPTG